MSSFVTGLEAAKDRSMSRGSDFTAFSLMSDEEKEYLCRTLLAEFGVTTINRVSERGEMIHSCCLPFGQHRNGDSNASASLNYKLLTYNCLGCGNSGGLLWFIATCRGTSSEDAREWLGKQTGVGDEQDLASLLRYFDALWNPKRVERPPLPNLDASVLEPWKLIHPWLTETRRIPVETIMRFQVGYAENYRLPVYKDGEVDHWMCSERIVIPHFWKEKLVGWQTRRLTNDGTDKYISSPDFPKDSTIFNYDPRRPALVVESPMSVLSKFHCCPIIEATFGAKVTDYQMRLLSEHTRVILFFDNDEAGWKATQVAGEALLPYSDVWVFDNPYNADAADLDDETFRELLASPVPFSVWKPPRQLVELGA